MKLQSVFNGNVGTNKQPDLHGNCSVVNINFWNIKFSHFIIWCFMLHVILSTSALWHLLLSLQKVVVCYLCGESGHIGNKCSNPICYNCNTLVHVASDCTGHRRSRYIDCHRCQMLGHTSYVSFFLKRKKNSDSITCTF